MDKNKFAPVAHDAVFNSTLLNRKGVRQAYDALEEEYTALSALLVARQAAGLSQEEVAQRMGTTASAVSRLESSLRNEKHSPSFATLRKYAAACGKRVVISLV